MPPVALLCNYLDDEEERRGFVDSMAEVKVKQEEVIMRQGDKGNNFYLIKAGTCDVWVADSSGERRNVRSLAAGSWCGELSLLTGKPRSASIMATSPEVTLLMVNRRSFNATLGDKIVKKRSQLMPFLQKLSIFAEVADEYELGLLADAAKEVRFDPGACIFCTLCTTTATSTADSRWCCGSLAPTIVALHAVGVDPAHLHL